MKIIRIDGNKNMNLECDRVTLSIAGNEYTISENFGLMNVLGNDGRLIIRPCVSNVIEIDQED